MRSILSLLLLASLCSIHYACSNGGGECAQAFDKEIECSDDPAAAKKEAKDFRKAAIAACNAAKDNERFKTAIECGKKKTCEEFRACNTKARSADDIKEIEAALGAGDPGKAMKECSYSLETYKAVPEFKAACDKAFAASFKNLEDEEARDDARYTCASSSQAAEWLAASEALKAGCVSLQGQLKALVTAQRDSGAEFDYGLCSGYKDMVKALSAADAPAAETLCNEADQADDFAKAMAAAQKNLDAKSDDIPFECKSFLEDKDKFEGSEWFAEKSKELATLCYGKLGKLALASVESYCPMDAKDTHAFALAFKLGEADAELQGLLDKTADKCKG